ncbi:hypothetical protein MJO28_008709 [Puccinia striiformis f. sp. tritici]|uniref:Secreted protein n=3 Tax=Puccinia striiformis TaxID=27350 RepID=A0A0L0UQN9_9BASI|nr:hypothetical protein MJO28_008709 [Puccinia striiformis f. sp. tritici]KNE89285.1 hypothetical protein PSTG_17255 [Puccinia striiformis f. sp. tritici PST-78]POW16822.1 hypothetical protein PSTT_00956 [Puccinia striiformis]
MFNANYKTISALIVLCLGVQVTTSIVNDVHTISPVDDLPSTTPITDRLKTEQSYRQHWRCPNCRGSGEHSVNCRTPLWAGAESSDESGGYDSSDTDDTMSSSDGSGDEE